MPSAIDWETMEPDGLSPVWFPPQDEADSDETHERLLQDAAAAHLLTMTSIPEAILRLLVRETGVARLPEPGAASDGEEAWAAEGGDEPSDGDDADKDALPPDSFEFTRQFHLDEAHRDHESLALLCRLDGAGSWRVVIETGRVLIEQL